MGKLLRRIAHFSSFSLLQCHDVIVCHVIPCAILAGAQETSFVNILPSQIPKMVADINHCEITIIFLIKSPKARLIQWSFPLEICVLQ